MIRVVRYWKILIWIVLLSGLYPVFGQTNTTMFYSGRVFEMDADGKSGKIAPFAEVRFVNEHNGINVTVKANRYGYYQAVLPEAEYRITTTDSRFKAYSMEDMYPNSGKIRTQDEMYRLGLGIDAQKANLRINREIAQQMRESKKRLEKKVPGSEPLVVIRSSQDTVLVGQPVVISVEAADGEGLESIWWYATYSKSRELSEKHAYACKGARKITRDWEIRIDKPGYVILTADATDIHYDESTDLAAHKFSDVRELPELRIVVLEKN